MKNLWLIPIILQFGIGIGLYYVLCQCFGAVLGTIFMAGILYAAYTSHPDNGE